MDITVYTLPGCAQCGMTKKNLEGRGIAFDAVDLSADPAAADMVRDLGYTSAPVVVAGDRHWHGFQPARQADLTA